MFHLGYIHLSERRGYFERAGGGSCNRFTIIHKNENAALALCDVDNVTEAAVTTVGLVVFNYLSSESKFQHGWYQIIDPITLPLSYVQWSV